MANHFSHFLSSSTNLKALTLSVVKCKDIDIFLQSLTL